MKILNHVVVLSFLIMVSGPLSYAKEMAVMSCHNPQSANQYATIVVDPAGPQMSMSSIEEFESYLAEESIAIGVNIEDGIKAPVDR